MRTCDTPVIARWSAISPIGRTAEQTGFFLRAGQSQIRWAPFIDEWGERLRMAYVPYVDTTLTGVGRLLALVREALAPLLGDFDGSLLIAIAVPERFASKPLQMELNGDGQQFAKGLTEYFAGKTGQVKLELFPCGRAGGALVLQRAAEWLKSSPSGSVIAGGVDSYYDWSVLEQLQRQDRVLTEDNIDGFVPGEGAAFLALSGDTMHDTVARVVGLGSGVEPASLLSRKASKAVGITNAMNAASALLRSSFVQSRYWLIDLTHEMYGIKEFQTVIARFGDIMGTNSVIDTPLREIGNMGAATLPLFAALACESWAQGYAPDRVCVASAGSDNGLRGVLVLEQSAV